MGQVVDGTVADPADLCLNGIEGREQEMTPRLCPVEPTERDMVVGSGPCRCTGVNGIRWTEDRIDRRSFCGGRLIIGESVVDGGPQIVSMRTAVRRCGQ